MNEVQDVMMSDLIDLDGPLRQRLVGDGQPRRIRDGL